MSAASRLLKSASFKAAPRFTTPRVSTCGVHKLLRFRARRVVVEAPASPLALGERQAVDLLADVLDLRERDHAIVLRRAATAADRALEVGPELHDGQCRVAEA